MFQQDASQARGTDIAPDDCRAQLERILGSSDFEATARERRFLGHVVEETLSGRGSRIKAYSIAVEVFGRDASFDPQGDPIVRIEAGHLRRSLERYYLTEGQADPVLITIPKGGYVPSFSLRTSPAPVSETAAPPVPPEPLQVAAQRPRRMLTLWPAVLALPVLAVLALVGWGFWADKGTSTKPEIPRLLVEPLGDLTGTETSAAVATGLTQEIIAQLSKFKDIAVIVSTDPSVSPPRYVLSGSVDLAADAFRLRVNLINRSDGSVLWANGYDGGMQVSELVHAKSDIAKQVATSLAQTYGVIFQADSAVKLENPPDDWAAYSCTLSYYAYRVDLNAKAREGIRSCLEKAVQRFPNYATAWALLSQIYVDDFRFSFPYNQQTQSVDMALAAAKRAIEIDPLNVRGLQAQMFALYFNNEIPASLKVGARALAINPNDTELMGEYGFRLALSGSWEEGCSLASEARERNPGPLAYYEVALSLCSYFRGDLKQAVTLIRNVTAPDNPLYHTIAAAIYAEAGLASDAHRERSWLESNSPALLANPRPEIQARLAREQDVERFANSLMKAGIQIPD